MDQNSSRPQIRRAFLWLRVWRLLAPLAPYGRDEPLIGKSGTHGFPPDVKFPPEPEWPARGLVLPGQPEDWTGLSVLMRVFALPEHWSERSRVLWPRLSGLFVILVLASVLFGLVQAVALAVISVIGAWGASLARNTILEGAIRNAVVPDTSVADDSDVGLIVCNRTHLPIVIRSVFLIPVTEDGGQTTLSYIGVDMSSVAARKLLGEKAPEYIRDGPVYADRERRFVELQPWTQGVWTTEKELFRILHHAVRPSCFVQVAYPAVFGGTRVVDIRLPQHLIDHMRNMATTPPRGRDT